MSPIDERLKSLNIVLPDVMPPVVDGYVAGVRAVHSFRRPNDRSVGRADPRRIACHFRCYCLDNVWLSRMRLISR